MQSIEQLVRDFAVPGRVEFAERGEGQTVLQLENAAAKAQVTLQGAQLIDYRCGGEPLIWLSEDARLAPGKSIRGGVPICWPWFGAHPHDPSLPAHGYARTVPWRLLRVDASNAKRTVLEFALQQSEATRRMFPHAVEVRYTLSIGEHLEVTLQTTNCGSDPLPLSQALHSYFQVGDVRKVSLHGLDGRDYLDKVSGFDRKTQHGTVRIAGEVDRIYLDTDGRCEIRDLQLRRRIRLTAHNSRSTVVWNPGPEKARQMGDLGADGYLRMLCVETANAASDARILMPGEVQRMALRVEQLGW